MASYDAAIASAARKRKLAEMLEAQSFKPNEIGLNVPGARMSWASALAPLLQGYASKKQGEEADREQSDAETAAREGLMAALKQGPERADLPGVDIPQEPVAPAPAPAPPAMPPADVASQFGPPPGPGANPMAAALLAGGAPPPAPTAMGPDAPAGGPMLPALTPFSPEAKTDLPNRDMGGMLPPKLTTDPIKGGGESSPLQLLQFASGLNQFGPEGKGISEQMSKAAIGGMTPLTPAQTAEMALKKQEYKDKLQERADESLRRSTDARLTAQEQAQAKKDHDATLLQIAGIAASARRGSGEGGPVTGHTVGQASEGPMKGARVRENKYAEREVQDPKTGKWVPYNGDVIPTKEFEKGVQDVTAARESLAHSDNLLQTLEQNPGAYGLGGVVSTLTGGAFHAPLYLTPEEREARANITMQMSEITKRIFGASFTTSEQYRGKPYIVEPGDSFESALSKLKNMQREARRVLDEKGSVATATSEKRNDKLPTATKKDAGGGGDIQSILDRNKP